MVALESQPDERNVGSLAGMEFVTEGPRAAKSLRDVLANKNPADTIDCILSDFSMEPMNGPALLWEIRTCHVAGMRPDVCFILLTITGERIVVGGAKEMDINGYMIKPVTRESLDQAALSRNQAACAFSLFGRGVFAESRHPLFRTPL